MDIDTSGSTCAMSGLFKKSDVPSGSGDDPTRALSVAASEQNRLYENALKLRITLQKSLDICNKLPANRRAVDLARSSDNSVGGAYKDLNDSAKDVLCQMHNLLLCQINKDDIGSSGKKRKATPSSSSLQGDVSWEDILQTQSLLRPRWEETINKLDKRMKYGSLVQEKQKGGLKLFNQTVFDQVEGIMSDSVRVCEKSRMAKKDSERIDTAFDDDSDEKEEGDEGEEGKGVNHDLHVYDDKQFYSTLLRSFITSSSAESGMNTLGAADLEALRQLKKGKKSSQVDRKASKGRRIRYVLHAKLQNFMFPVPHAKAGDEDDGKIFQSLFQ